MVVDGAAEVVEAAPEEPVRIYCPVLVQYSERAPSAETRQTDIDDTLALAKEAVGDAARASLKLYIHEHAERGEETSLGALFQYWIRNAQVETREEKETLAELVASAIDRSPRRLLKGKDDKNRLALLFELTSEQFNIVKSLLEEAPVEAPVNDPGTAPGTPSPDDGSADDFVEPPPAVDVPTPTPETTAPLPEREPWADSGAPANVTRKLVSTTGTSEIYPRQRDVASIILNRIERVLQSNSKRPLSSFKDVKFLIGTAYLNTLRDQTRARLNNLSEAHRVLPPGVQDGKSFVVTYGSGADNYDVFWKFRKSALEKTDVLHLLIMDECHWGSTKGGWNALYVNDTPVTEGSSGTTGRSSSTGGSGSNGNVELYNPIDNKPDGTLLRQGNFLVLLVSATPYNVLTAASRVPKRALPPLSGPNATAASASPSSDRDDHVILWDEEFQHRLSKGPVDVHLKSCARRVEKLPESGKKSTVPPNRASVERSDACGMFQDGDDFVEASETGLVLKRQPERDVRGSGKLQTRIRLIKPRLDADPDQGVLMSVLTPKNEEKWIAVSNTNTVQLELETKRAVRFRLRQEFGYGVLAFELIEAPTTDTPSRSAKRVLMVDTATCQLTIGTDATSHNQLTRQFLYEEVTSGGDQVVYQSLTYYFNTMRLFNPMDRRIRTDDPQTSASPVGHGDPVQILAFDYAYSILHFAAFWAPDCLSENSSKPNTPLDSARMVKRAEPDQQAWWTKCHEKLDTLIKLFDQRYLDSSHGVRSAANMTLQRLRLRREEWAEAALPTGFVHSKSGACAAAWNILKYSAAAANNADRFKEITAFLKSLPKGALDAGWEHAVSETERLLHDLIVNNTAMRADGGGLELSGKMKIVRITTIDEATKFYNTIRLASEIAQLQGQYAILADYGTMDIDDQFKKDKLLKVWRGRLANNNKDWIPCAYEDLLGLPCLLVLVQRGRMGDTFPTSFNCLDMRLSYNTSGSPIHLSTLVQELGRLCRYAPRTTKVSDLPYALVSKRLFDKLVDALQNNLTLAKGFLTTPDQRVTLAKDLSKCVYPPVRWAPAVATPVHYDGEIRRLRPDTERHDRRLVLQAEPQIGKTGTFLALIRMLQDAVKAQPNIICVPDITLEQDNTGAPDLWEFPHWKLMDSFRPELPRQLVADSKYNVHNPLRHNEPWRYGDVFPRDKLATLEEKILPVGLQLPAQRTVVTVPRASASNSNLLATASALSAAAAHATWVVDHENRYRWAAHDMAHDASGCPVCAPDITKNPRAVHLDLKDADLTTMGLPSNKQIRVSVPEHYVERKYVEVGPTNRVRIQPTLSASSTDGAVQLQHWMVTPSVRPETALLNLTHAMFTVKDSAADGQRVRHAQMVAARPGADFDAFVKHWGHRLLIVELPETMNLADTRGSEGYELQTNPRPCAEKVTQGVGYARRFLQLVAEAFRLPFAYMVDDNLFHMAELILPPQTREGAQQLLETKPCTLGDVLLHLQSAATGHNVSGAPVVPPQQALVSRTEIATAPPPYPDRRAGNADNNMQTDRQLFDYTGPPENYGAWGTHKCEFRATTLSPFKRGHVHSLVLLNINVLKEEKVAYQCWPFWEDLDFDAQMFHAGLWTCKFNRFIQVKRWAHGGPPPSPPSRAASRLPGLFEWPQDAVIQWPSAPADRDSSELLRLLKALPVTFKATGDIKIVIDIPSRRDIDEYLIAEGAYARAQMETAGLWDPIVPPYSLPFVMMKSSASETAQSIVELYDHLVTKLPRTDVVHCAVILRATPAASYACSTQLDDLCIQVTQKGWQIPVHDVHMFTVTDPRTVPVPSVQFLLVTFVLEHKSYRPPPAATSAPQDIASPMRSPPTGPAQPATTPPPARTPPLATTPPLAAASPTRSPQTQTATSTPQAVRSPAPPVVPAGQVSGLPGLAATPAAMDGVLAAVPGSIALTKRPATAAESTRSNPAPKKAKKDDAAGGTAAGAASSATTPKKSPNPRKPKSGAAAATQPKSVPQQMELPMAGSAGSTGSAGSAGSTGSAGLPGSAALGVPHATASASVAALPTGPAWTDPVRPATPATLPSGVASAQPVRPATPATLPSGPVSAQPVRPASPATLPSGPASTQPARLPSLMAAPAATAVASRPEASPLPTQPVRPTVGAPVTAQHTAASPTRANPWDRSAQRSPAGPSQPASAGAEGLQPRALFPTAGPSPTSTPRPLPTVAATLQPQPALATTSRPLLPQPTNPTAAAAAAPLHPTGAPAESLVGKSSAAESKS